MIQAATGGSLLTGIGGDEVFRSRGELWWLVGRPPWSHLPRELAWTALHALPKNTATGRLGKPERPWVRMAAA